MHKGFCVLLPPDTKATDVWITGYVATHVGLGIFDVGLLSNISEKYQVTRTHISMSCYFFQ